MKSLFSVLICAVSIQSAAEGLVRDFKDSINFKFEQNIELRPSKEGKKVFSAGISLAEPDQGKQKIRVHAGSAENSDNDCVIQKNFDQGENPAFYKIQSSYSSWSVKIKKHELTPDGAWKLKASSGYEQGGKVKGVVYISYNEEFELKNDKGVTLTLLCKEASCTEPIPYEKKIRCNENISASAEKVLAALGVKTQNSIQENLVGSVKNQASKSSVAN